MYKKTFLFSSLAHPKNALVTPPGPPQKKIGNDCQFFQHAQVYNLQFYNRNSTITILQSQCYNFTNLQVQFYLRNFSSAILQALLAQPQSRTKERLLSSVTRVTRLGEFSLVWWLVTLRIFVKMT
jgi:hypothetical protein